MNRINTFELYLCYDIDIAKCLNFVDSVYLSLINKKVLNGEFTI